MTCLVALHSASPSLCSSTAAAVGLLLTQKSAVGEVDSTVVAEAAAGQEQPDWPVTGPGIVGESSHWPRLGDGLCLREQ